ncbi:MAG: YqgE/AlgH family protein [Rubripirellula sp.]
MDLFTGNLLVASSLVTEPVYAGGVCLIVHQDETNVIGVMLNRPMQPNPEALAAILDQQPKSTFTNRLAKRETSSTHHEFGSHSGGSKQSNFPHPMLGMLHFGGPLSGPVVAIHQTSQYAEAETGAGIYVAAQKQHLENLVREQSSPYRLIVGHLGWEWDQLDAEIDAGIWHVIPASAEAVFTPAKEMWRQLIRRATSSSMARWMGVPDAVDASELN